MADKHAAQEGLSAKEGLALLKDIHARGVTEGHRDDPLYVRVAEAIAKLEPPPPEPKGKTEHKTPEHR